MPICWSGDFAPYSVIGDVRWSDVATQVDILVNDPGAQRIACCVALSVELWPVLVCVCVCVCVCVWLCARVRVCAVVPALCMLSS